jgi:hypothetical protein
MRHVATTTRTILATTVLAGSLTLTGVALADRARSGSSSSGDSGDDRDHRTTLVQVPSCWGTPIATPTTPPPVGGVTQTVVVRIEPTSLLKLDSDGHVVAAETNTGCAPRPTDHIYVVLRNGDLIENRKVDVSKVKWTGDFTEFGFVPQRHD